MIRAVQVQKTLQVVSLLVFFPELHLGHSARLFEAADHPILSCVSVKCLFFVRHNLFTHDLWQGWGNRENGHSFGHIPVMLQLPLPLGLLVSLEPKVP